MTLPLSRDVGPGREGLGNAMPSRNAPQSARGPIGPPWRSRRLPSRARPRPGRPDMRVTVLGAGYVGATSAVVLAHLGHHVSCVERDAARLECWRSGKDPLNEPGLAELLARHDVLFVDSPSYMASADVIVVAVGTPMGSGGVPDLSQLEAAVDEIAAFARDGTVVLMRSTVPVGTCDRLQNGPLRHLCVVSNPEFLREGHAVHDALLPDRIVAGGPHEARPVVEELYRRIIDGEFVSAEGSGRQAVPVFWMYARSAA